MSLCVPNIHHEFVFFTNELNEIFGNFNVIINQIKPNQICNVSAIINNNIQPNSQFRYKYLSHFRNFCLSHKI